MNKKEFLKNYIVVVLPLMFQGMITKLVSMVDNLMVGQLGDNAIASVTIGNKVLDIIMFTMMGITASGSIFIAQYFGAKNRKKQQEVFRIILLSVSTLLCGSMAILKTFPKQITYFFIQDSFIQQGAMSYIAIMLIGYVPLTYSLAYASALKVVGQVKVPLFASIVGVVVNTSINYLIIFGHFGFPQLGIQGAAIATVISRFIEFGIIYTVSKLGHYDFNTRLIDIFKISKNLTKEVILKSFPLAINEIIWSFGQATLLKFYGVRGNEVISSMAISDTTSSIFFAINQGIAAATPILVSQKLGANEFDKAYYNAKQMIQTAAILGLLLGIGMWTMSEIVPYLYHISSQSLNLSRLLIKVSGCCFWIYVMNAQCYFIMRSGGDMVSTLIMDGLFTWCITLPTIALCVYTTNWYILVVYFVAQVCDVLKLIVSLLFFKKKRWLKNITV